MSKRAACAATGHAFVIALVFSMTGPALAADCRAAPGDAAPAGQHWYYRLDRATGQQCWYLRKAAPVRAAEPSKPVRAAEPSPPVRASRRAATKPAREAARMKESSKEALFEEFQEWRKGQEKQ
jgi:hypothetical protein